MELSGLGALGMYLLLAFVLPGFCYLLVFGLCFKETLGSIGTRLEQVRTAASGTFHRFSPGWTLSLLAIVGGLLLSSICLAIEMVLVRNIGLLRSAFPDLHAERIAWVEAAGRGTLHLQVLAGSAFMHFNVALGVLILLASYAILHRVVKKGGSADTINGWLVFWLVLVIGGNFFAASAIYRRARCAIDGAVRAAGLPVLPIDGARGKCSDGDCCIPGQYHPYDNLDSILWVQTAVEYRANAEQTYRAAAPSLQRALKDVHWTAALEQTQGYEGLAPAIILDLDETVLDNSVFDARRVAAGEPYSDQAWTKWADEEKAGLVPGAAEFLQFAWANHVAPLYVTNRTCDPSKIDDPTVKVLRALHLPLEDPIADRLYCSRNSSDTDKTARRKVCAKKYRILLLFGDQLEDFLEVPPGLANLQGREQLYWAHHNMWGEKWFALPNPMYGSWQRALGPTLGDKLGKLNK